MKKTPKLTFLSLFLCFVSVSAFAQNLPEKGSIGISASLQGNQTDILFPIWASDQVSIAPVIGIIHTDDVSTQLDVGIKPRFYQDLGENFASYFGFQGLIQYTSPETGDDQTDFIIGANTGGEYYFDPHFSMGVEGQLNFFLRDNDDNAIATGAAITGTYYF